MEIVAGLSLRNLKPRVWDSNCPHYLPNLTAVMVSYADFHQSPQYRKAALEHGLRKFLGVPDSVRVYLDNGAFFFSASGLTVDHKEYEEFVASATPDWRPIPQDFIPFPSMSDDEQLDCMTRTMAVNIAFEHDGYVPVVHVSKNLPQYIAAVSASPRLCAKPSIALGGIVPHLLRRSKAHPYQDVLARVKSAREAFRNKTMHLYGVGGTATVHIASLLEMDSVDSSGWRNRAARGMVQLPGSGERSVVSLGAWRGREPTAAEWTALNNCLCPACVNNGLSGLKASGIDGFCNRATHNLWTLLNEAEWIRKRLADGTYANQYADHLDNTTYRPIIDHLVEERGRDQASGVKASQ